jgi:protein-S-isoprenylcysteine O-methyltransferase Ste14
MFLEKSGRLLFRWRSFTPVPLLIVAALLIWRSRGPASPLWLIGGLALCLAGQALRAWVLGQVPDGTSGQNEKLIATELNTHGPYAYTRNPLYLGNLGIVLGLCLIAHDPLLLVVVAALFGLQYRAIIAAEEGFLRARFGAQFDDYCSRVPRFWPLIRGHPAQILDQPAELAQSMRRVSPNFDWRRVLRKEHNPAAAWIALAIILVALDHLKGPLWPYAIALGVTAVAWLSIKGWKHRWLKGGFAEDIRRRLRETAR